MFTLYRLQTGWSNSNTDAIELNSRFYDLWTTHFEYYNFELGETIGFHFDLSCQLVKVMFNMRIYISNSIR